MQRKNTPPGPVHSPTGPPLKQVAFLGRPSDHDAMRQIAGATGLSLFAAYREASAAYIERHRDLLTTDDTVAA